MTPNTLARLASLLYGRHWQTALAGALIKPTRLGRVGVHVSLVNWWASGARPIPSWVEGELYRLLYLRRIEIAEVLDEPRGL